MNLKEFSDSLKKVFGSLLPLKTADSNYAVGLYNKADGTPAGMMDMPSLASVLGVNESVIQNTSKQITLSPGDNINIPAYSFSGHLVLLTLSGHSDVYRMMSVSYNAVTKIFGSGDETINGWLTFTVSNAILKITNKYSSGVSFRYSIF